MCICIASDCFRFFSDSGGEQVDVTQSIRHRLERATAAVDAERDCSILVPGYPLDERALHPGIP